MTAQLRPYVELDECVVMLNHFHGILVLADVGARRRRAPTQEQFGKPVAGSLPTIMRAFKSATTYRINQSRGARGAPIWQRNYYEHIVRHERELNAIREYIQNNPVNWAMDMDNLQNVRRLPPPEIIDDYLNDSGIARSPRMGQLRA